MTDEAVECAAAFFRIKGKEMVTPKEFSMTVSLDLKWMSVKEAEALADYLLERGAVVKSNGYIKPGEDYSDVRVPIAYRPPEGLRKEVSDRASKRSARRTKTPRPGPDSGDMFPEMVEAAVRASIPRGKFIAECNKVRKRLNVETVAAALLVLRDAGVDVSGMSGRVYAQIAYGKG